MSKPDWLESLEEQINTAIAMHGLDPTLAWEDVKDMAMENADIAWDEDN